MKKITIEKIKNILETNKSLNFAARALALEVFLRNRGIDAVRANVVARLAVSASQA